MKEFVKGLNVKGDCFQFICTTFPGLSYDKIKTGVFDGTQKLFKLDDEVEKRAWNASVAVVKEVLGIQRLQIIRIWWRHYLIAFML